MPSKTNSAELTDLKRENAKLRKELAAMTASRDSKWVKFLKAYEAMRALCPDCRTPEESGTRNGYTCPKHRDLLA